ncbi:MAG TPA: CpaD family pilus assembly lipoprotein [Reyranella sp.]|nr:CpaD family pilus assembly lipoprotein [Reyranella sp.]
MRSAIVSLLAASLLAACGNPVAEQAAVDTRHTPKRADQLFAVDFAPGSPGLDARQEGALRALVGAAGERAQRDEFVVVTNGFGGTLQQHRAAVVARNLSLAGARWVSASVEPAMAQGPDQVVVVRSEYRLGSYGCPNYSPATIWNPNESAMPGYGCSDAYNMGQMLARPRDAAVGRPPGPADGTVAADAVQRYREGRVRAASAPSVGSGGGGGAPLTPSP